MKGLAQKSGKTERKLFETVRLFVFFCIPYSFPFILRQEAGSRTWSLMVNLKKKSQTELLPHRDQKVLTDRTWISCPFSPLNTSSPQVQNSCQTVYLHLLWVCDKYPEKEQPIQWSKSYTFSPFKKYLLFWELLPYLLTPKWQFSLFIFLDCSVKVKMKEQGLKWRRSSNLPLLVCCICHNK